MSVFDHHFFLIKNIYIDNFEHKQQLRHVHSYYEITVFM